MSGCLADSVVREDLSGERPAALLTRSVYPNLTVEVSYFPGFAPEPDAVADLIEFVTRTVTKDQIVVRGPFPINGSAKEEWNSSSVMELHAATFRSGSPRVLGENESAFLHILYLPGAWESPALGVSLGNVNAIFIEQIRRLDYAWVGAVNADPEYLEVRVLRHEFGHSVGLVDNGIPMMRARLHADGHHSTNPDSVMYAGATHLEVAGERGVLSSMSIEFDSDDLADIAAFKAR